MCHGSLWLGLGHGFGSSDYGTTSPVMGKDASRINVKLGFFEGKGDRLVIVVIIIQYS